MNNYTCEAAMYAGKNTPIELPKKGHLHILTNGYVYWENDGKWDKEARRMRDSRVSIGKLADAEKGLFYPNRKYWELFPDGKHNADGAIRIQEKAAPTGEPGKFSSRLNYGAYLALRLAAEKIGLLETLKETFPDTWEKIFALTVHFICDECSTDQAFPFWQFDNYCGLGNRLTDDEISRLYRDIGTDQNGIDSFMEFFHKRYEKSVYGDEPASSGQERALTAYALDSTNHNTSCRDNDMAEFGAAKKKEGLPDINFAAFVDEKTGIPVYYELFFGSLLDKSQTPFTIKNAERLGFRKLFVVMDRGYYRKEVFEAFEGMSFACMCPESMPEFDKVWSKHHSEIKDQHKYFVPAEKVYGIKVDDVKVYDRTYKAFLYYDSARAEDERDTIHLKLGMLKEQAVARKNYTAKMKSTFAPWLIIEKLDAADPETGKKFRITENNERIQEELDKAGFFLVVSDCDCSTEEMIIRARKRDVDEKTFRRAKSHFDFTKTGTHSRETYQGKMFACYLALIVSSAFCWYTKKYIKAVSSRTMATTLGLLKKYQIQQQKDQSWFPVYAITKNMREVFMLLGLENPDTEVPEMVKKLCLKL